LLGDCNNQISPRILDVEYLCWRSETFERVNRSEMSRVKFQFD
jgi:hypothetical protein